jgi:hypothetical protein
MNSVSANQVSETHISENQIPENQTTQNQERAVGALAEALDVLAAGGVDAAILYDGDGHGCPHCASQVLPAAA